MEKKIVLLVLSLFASVFGQAQTGTIEGNYKIKGVVRSNSTDVISGMNLFVNKGSEAKWFVTDINGEFELSLQPGDYFITVNKVNSPDFKAFIKIMNKGLNPNNIEFGLDPRRVCCFTRTGTPFPKPTSLPKPAYPAAARAVHAIGEVVVDLRIGVDGNTISASAVNGHALLRAAAVAAAKASRFETTDISGERDATLTYVFLHNENEKKGITRYVNPYRIEVVPNDVLVMDTENIDPLHDRRSILSRVKHLLRF